MGAVPTREEIKARVQRGAARLDEHDPNWALQVEPITVVMAYMSECVLGRYFGDYAEGLAKLGLTLDTPDGVYTTEHDTVQLGFDLAHSEAHGDECQLTDEGREAYRQLTDEWRFAIAERRNRGPVPALVGTTS